jgi:hydrogenase-4 transcriptional activator
MVNLPLLARGTCLGTLNIGSVASGEPDGETLEFLRQFAIQVALAFENVRAYEQLAQLSQQLAKQNAYLTEEIKQECNSGLLVGKSKVLREVLAQIQAVAATSSTVLIMGETGTGKELVARAIHESSLPASSPLSRFPPRMQPRGKSRHGMRTANDRGATGLAMRYNDVQQGHPEY